LEARARNRSGSSFQAGAQNSSREKPEGKSQKCRSEKPEVMVVAGHFLLVGGCREREFLGKIRPYQQAFASARLAATGNFITVLIK
jgi:hypothetical protein